MPKKMEECLLVYFSSKLKTSKSQVFHVKDNIDGYEKYLEIVLIITQ
jgi:hypothetical protein